MLIVMLDLLRSGRAFDCAVLLLSIQIVFALPTVFHASTVNNQRVTDNGRIPPPHPPLPTHFREARRS